MFEVLCDILTCASSVFPSPLAPCFVTSKTAPPFPFRSTFALMSFTVPPMSGRVPIRRGRGAAAEWRSCWFFVDTIPSATFAAPVTSSKMAATFAQHCQPNTKRRIWKRLRLLVIVMEKCLKIWMQELGLLKDN